MPEIVIEALLCSEPTHRPKFPKCDADAVSDVVEDRSADRPLIRRSDTIRIEKVCYRRARRMRFETDGL